MNLCTPLLPALCAPRLQIDVGFKGTGRWPVILQPCCVSLVSLGWG